MYQWIGRLAKRFARTKSTPVTPAGTSQGCPQVEALEDRKVLSGTFAHGIVANNLNSRTFGTTLNMLHDTNTRSVRMWVTVRSFGNRTPDPAFRMIRRMHDAGIDITLSVVPQTGLRGSYDQVFNYFNWIGGNLASSVDRWEIGNEPDFSFRGHLGDYVNGLLKPAAAALHGHGEKVVSGGPSWNSADIKTMVDAGMLKFVDFVGYHPYRHNVAELVKSLAEIKSYIGGKPLVASEWSPRVGSQGSAAWNDAIKAFWPVIRDNFYAAYFFAAFKTGSMAGGGGLMTNSSGGRNGQFYATYKGLTASSGGSGSVFGNTPVTIPSPITHPVSTPKPAPAPAPTTGSTAVKAPAKKPTIVAQAVVPKIKAFRILNAATGKVLKGFESITSSESIKASALPTRYIQIEAITSNAGSVRFTFTGKAARTENSAPFTAFANSKGQASAWFATKGTFALTATGYSGKYLGGTKGNKLGVTLTFR